MLCSISIFYLPNAITEIDTTQQPSSQISQVIHHKKAEWISFQTNINVEIYCNIRLEIKIPNQNSAFLGHSVHEFV